LAAERRVRLLLVINQFGQGGSERYLFELCSALDRTKFDVNILTRKGVDRTAHYYPRIVAAGVKIHAIRPHVPEFRSLAPSLAVRKRYRVIRDRLSSALARWRIGAFLDSFDLVACIQIENYLGLQHAFRHDQPVVIHAMSNRFQYAYDPYDEFCPDREYRFVTWNVTQVEEMAALRRATTFSWPLSMSFRDYPVLPVPPLNGGPLKIGIFTRLSREKPLEPLFASFAQLLSRVDATLHVYGGGDATLFADDIARLGISDRVYFEGHRENMTDTARRDDLSMCWLMSLGTLLGYASLELAACGMPMVFWNYGSWDTDRIRVETGGAVNAFSSVADFVAFSIECLMDHARLSEVGARLRQFVLDKHDIEKNIPELEDYYLGVVRNVGYSSSRSE
jgi:glycosyltransferase involved in cell wall biosynthesis